MMGGNQFHFTLITTYSSGRHLCTDPVVANSQCPSVCVCVWARGVICVCVCLCINVGLPLCPPPSPNEINGSVTALMYILKSSLLSSASLLPTRSYFEGRGGN